MDSIDEQQDSFSQEPMPPQPQAKPPHWNREATAISVLAAVLVIGLIAQLLLGPAQPAPSGIASSATATTAPATATAAAAATATATTTATTTTTTPPSPTAAISPFALEDGLSFTSRKPKYPQYSTPQAAFSRAIVYLCGTAKPRSQTVTWLTSGLEQGLVLIQGRCADGRQPYIFGQIDRAADHCFDWDVQMALFIQDRPVNVPAKNRADVPFWLPLPHEEYESENIVAEVPPPLYGFQAWASSKHIYVATRYQAPGPRPFLAVSVTVHGAAGWYVSLDGMTVITVPLSGNQAFSFTANGSVADVLPLAQATLANLGTILPKLPATPALTCP